MSPEGLQIRMGADVSRAIAGLKQVETAMQKTVSNSKSFEASVGKSGQALGKIVNPSNQATLALTNLGRVAQDAPFGFLGIANNLNPLLESFQRLKATTGTTGGALKALGKSLTGAGGLGFALSIASSLLVVFGDRLFGSGKKAKEAADEYKRVQDVLKSVSGSIEDRSKVAAASATDEIAKINILSNVIKDQTKSYNERNNALNQLKSINKNYFGDLTLEASSLATLTGKVDEYTQALIAAAVVKEFSSDIAKLAVESAKGINAYNSLGKELDQLNKKLEVTQKYIKTEGRQDAINKLNPEYTKLKNKIDDVNDALQKQGSIVADVSKASRVSSEGLSQAIQQSLKFKPLNVSGGTVNVKPDAIKVFTDTSKISIDIIPPEEFKPVAVSAATLFSKEFGEYFKKPGVIDFSLIQAVNDNKLNKETKDLAKDLGTNFSQSFRDAINSGISSIGEGIGNVLSGQDFGSSITDAFSGLLSSLGKALIEYGLIKEGLDKILGPGGIAIPGAVAIGLGVLAIAASTALKNIGGARASGGPVAGNTPYLVGERGPEIFTPSVSGSIIPNNQISSFSGRSQMATVRVTGRLRGNDMILQNARTNRMQTRLG